MKRIIKPCAVLLVAIIVVLAVDAPASAAPKPKRPHPHRKPWPITVTVQTVPALAGIQFTFDGKPLTTDAAGRAAYTQEHNFAKHTLNLVTTSLDLPDRRYRFARWGGQRDPNQAFRADLAGLPMRANYTVTAAFNVQYPISANFVDQRGRPLDLDKISVVRIKSDAGEVVDLPKQGTIWLSGGTATYRNSAVVVNDVGYSLQTMVMNGTNIVDAGRQRFVPAKGTGVTFTGQLHDLTIGGGDALYRGEAGKAAVVTYPDGSVRKVPFGADGTATLAGLPRGTYAVKVAGATGIVLDQRVGLSRDRRVTIFVVTRGDLVTVTGFAVLVAAALLMVGRLRRYLLNGLSNGVRLVRRWRHGEVTVG